MCDATGGWIARAIDLRVDHSPVRTPRMNAIPLRLAADHDSSTGEPNNLQRALSADTAIRSFIECTQCELEDSLGDLLCDLMHWSAIVHFEFDAALHRARAQFEDEANDSGCGCKHEPHHDVGVARRSSTHREGPPALARREDRPQQIRRVQSRQGRSAGRQFNRRRAAPRPSQTECHPAVSCVGCSIGLSLPLRTFHSIPIRILYATRRH